MSGHSGDGALDYVSTKRFLDLFAGANDGPTISWANWNYADKREGSSALAPGACRRLEWDAVSCSGQYLRAYIQHHVQRDEEDGETTTTTSAPAPTPPPSAAPPPPPPPSQYAYGQCGGRYRGKPWDGPTRCADGLVCRGKNPWKMCMPDAERDCNIENALCAPDAPCCGPYACSGGRCVCDVDGGCTPTGRGRNFRG